MLILLRRQSLSRLQFKISNPKIYHGKKEVKKDNKIPSYPCYGLRNNRSGVIFFNKPNYENKLNMDSMQEMYRFLRSYETDQNIQHIWVENKGNNCFSNGVDYKQLISSPKYLHRVFQLGIMMAKLNKPVFGHVKGLVGGTAAYLLKYLSTPFGDRNTHLKLHDIDNHFIPICGGSYLLSRLSGQLGTYLALTGDVLNSNDMVGAGFIYGLLRKDHTENEIRKIVGDISKTGARYFDYDTFDFGKNKQGNDWSDMVQLSKQNFALAAHIEKISIMKDPKKQLRVARLAEVSYNSLQVGIENLKRPYKQVPDEHVMDYFGQKEQPVLSEFEQKYLQPHKGEVVRGFPLLIIKKVFAHDTIEEIITALKMQGTLWAKDTIKKLQQKDALTLKLTLRLIRQASKSDYPECLERQYRVASKLRLHESFRKFHSGQSINKKALSQISVSAVNHFFQINNQQHELLHDLVPYSLLPVKQYRRNLPDPIRFFLNRQFWNDPNNGYQEQEVFRWLRRNSISCFNDTYDLDDLRKRMYLYQAALGQLKSHWARIDRMYYNHAAQKKFKQKRIRYVEEIFSKSNIKQLIQEKVIENFNKKFESRMEDLKPTVQIFSKEQKGKLYSALRDILVKKRLTKVLGQNTNEHILGLVKFDRNGGNVIENPQLPFKGTPLEHIINSMDSEGKVVKPLPAQYYDRLSQQLDPKIVEPLATTKNQHLMEVLKRYQEGMYFYSRNDGRKDLKFFKQASEYSQKVKELLKQYSTEQLKDIFHREERFSWRHMLKQIQELGADSNFSTTIVEAKGKIPTFQEFYNLDNDNDSILQKLNVPLPEGFKIPKQLQQRSNKLLKMITSKLLANFGDWNSHTLENKIPILDNWIRETIALDSNQFIKSDCHFIFSYFMIKDIEAIITKLGNLGSNQQTMIKLREIGINFEKFEDIQPAFHNYFTELIELYNTAVQGIVLKNTKLLQMHNRIRTNQQVDAGFPQIDKFLIEMGRLRLKLKQRTDPSKTIFNYDTQFNLQTLTGDIQALDNLGLEHKKTSLTLTANAYDTKFKKLVTGYESYIERIDFMFKKINSTTDYLPDILTKVDNLEGFQTLTQDIDEDEPLNIWFDRKFAQAVEIIFNHRLEVQKNLNSQELKIFDIEIAGLLQPSFLKNLVIDILNNDISSLMTFKREQIKSNDKGISKSMPSPRRSILNQEAFRKLTNLVNAIDVIESRSMSSQILEKYQTTMYRLIQQMTSEPVEKPLNESALQKLNFTSTAKLQKIDTSDVNFIKEEFKTLTKIYEEDPDLIELSKILG